MTEQSGIALVTGANKGIGREIAAQLADLGMSVLLAARDQRRGEEAAEDLRAGGGDVHAITLDVTDPASADAAAGFVADRFGRLDVLVNNAGISPVQGLELTGADLEVVREVFETNVFGVITVTNAMLPLLKRSPAGRIVNMSSVVGSLTAQSDPDGPLAGIAPTAAYPPSKTALNALTVQYAKELRKSGILVNAADPGGTATDMTRARGYEFTRTAADGAAVAVRLATLDADGPTGGFFSDGGRVPW